MKIFYKCDVCDRTHDTMYAVGKCESSHTIITPKWYWYVPFVSWCIMIYLISIWIGSAIKHAKWDEEASPFPTLMIENEWKHKWVFLNPIIITMIYCWIIVFNSLHR